MVQEQDTTTEPCIDVGRPAVRALLDELRPLRAELRQAVAVRDALRETLASHEAAAKEVADRVNTITSALYHLAVGREPTAYWLGEFARRDVPTALRAVAALPNGSADGADGRPSEGDDDLPF